MGQSTEQCTRKSASPCDAAAGASTPAHGDQRNSDGARTIVQRPKCMLPCRTTQGAAWGRAQSSAQPQSDRAYVADGVAGSITTGRVDRCHSDGASIAMEGNRNLHPGARGSGRHSRRRTGVHKLGGPVECPRSLRLEEAAAAASAGWEEREHHGLVG